MSNYKRLYVPGGTYFFTLVTYKKRPILTTKLARDCLHKAWKQEQQKRTFQTVAVCLLPNHLHCLISLPLNDSDFSTRIQKIKSGFTRLYLQNGGKEIPVSHSQKQENRRGIWQRHFWEHCIRDDKDFGNHLDYIHYNPVKHGLVKQCKFWPHSTFHKYVKMGWYDIEWGEAELETFAKINFGE